ncbi:hypothetical protein [Paenibacillus thalictri]|uniref:ACT domain-containing protein n=1 Tax=Paenibacillus thalictri TaxID=2527873 RepID=A0A4Q9DCI6_9BACL|nr:hypothetical protein [Paenibacillus thalictri]TBL68270.1 hypothetical protein EYB31_38420 [Paenibacillus thalictri]
MHLVPTDAIYLRALARLILVVLSGAAGLEWRGIGNGGSHASAQLSFWGFQRDLRLIVKLKMIEQPDGMETISSIFSSNGITIGSVKMRPFYEPAEAGFPGKVVVSLFIESEEELQFKELMAAAEQVAWMDNVFSIELIFP